MSSVDFCLMSDWTNMSTIQCLIISLNTFIMKLQHVFLCSLLILTALSCTKERIKNDEINGSVQHLTDGEFLADVPVVLV